MFSPHLFCDRKTVIGMCQNLAKFYYTRATLKNFGQYEWVHFAFRKILSLLWRILNSIGQILIVEKDQMLNKQSAIWSH